MNLIKIPFSGGGLGKGDGSNLAPDLIEKHLKNIFSNENENEGIFQIENLTMDEKNIEVSHKIIEKRISSQVNKAIILGGDHSITFPCVKGFSKNNKDFMLIVFDAHPDLMDNFIPPTQEDYLKTLIENNIVKPENIILIGVRNWEKSEISYIKEKNIKSYSCKEIYETGFKNITKEIVNSINLPVYLSIDIDSVDPVEAIGTGYTEHGGLTTRELIYAIQKIKETKQIKMCDIVEINPKKDINEITSILGAKLVAELSDI